MNENQEFEFLKEKIKEKPINKKKLLRRTMITASMAVVFGLVACVTFLVLEPVFSNWLYPEEPPQTVTFPKEENEIMPEDMLLEDPIIPPTVEEPSLEPKDVPDNPLEIEDYQLLYTKLSEIAKEASKSMVTVTGVTSDVDWFDNTYENKGQTSGVIIGNNGNELTILVKKDEIEQAESIRVTFVDGKQAIALLKKENENTGLAALTVDLLTLDNTTKESIAVATLGTSNSAALLGKPIIAIGNPIGYNESISYGIITSIGNTLSMPDSNYNLMTTDIVGHQSASGILIDLQGELLGIIHQENNEEGMQNIVAALGISELKNMIQKMCDGVDVAYLGVYTLNVTKEANEAQGVPLGVFVSETAMDSPAMRAGIQSGDVIVKINDTNTDTILDYTKVLNEILPDKEVVLTIMRSSKNGYQEMEFTIQTEKMK